MAKTVTTTEGDITVPLTNSDSNSTFYQDSDRDRVIVAVVTKLHQH